MKAEYVYGTAIFAFVLFAPVIAGILIDFVGWAFS